MKNRLSLGIDTSNYKTSVAVVCEDEVVFDKRILLKVRKGERGLRQQEALFQHITNLPGLIKEAFSAVREVNGEIASVSASSRPRNIEGSYMPCFNAGVSAAEMIASSLGLEAKLFSHQEGHIKAAKRFTELKDEERFIAFHFSGGTTESLMVDEGRIEIIGGTKDISFGQVLDRVGVNLDMEFPAGEELDRLAALGEPSGGTRDGTMANFKSIPRIKINDGFINLSGLETSLRRMIEENKDEIIKEENLRFFSLRIFKAFADGISLMMDSAAERTGMNTFLFSGGVSSSETLRKLLKSGRAGKDEIMVFSEPHYSSDNAVGIAYLGGEDLWPWNLYR